MVGVGAVVGGARLLAVDEEGVIGEGAIHEAVVHVTVVQAVLVLRARLAEVRQLVQLVAPSQPDRLHTIRRCVGQAQAVADRTLHRHVADLD